MSAGSICNDAPSRCRPCASKDPRMSRLDVLRLSAVQQTIRNIVYRDDCRFGEARLGAQGEGHSWVYCQVQRRSTGVVRAARFARGGICPRAGAEEMEAGLENRAYRGRQSAVDRPISLDCALRREQEQADWWVPACAGTTRMMPGRQR